jgi:hypothetical protein
LVEMHIKESQVTSRGLRDACSVSFAMVVDFGNRNTVRNSLNIFNLSSFVERVLNVIERRTEPPERERELNTQFGSRFTKNLGEPN